MADLAVLAKNPGRISFSFEDDTNGLSTCKETVFEVVELHHGVRSSRPNSKGITFGGERRMDGEFKKVINEQ